MSSASSPLQKKDAQPPFYAGIDLGGTNIKVGIVDDRGRSMGFYTTPTESHDGPEAGAKRMGEAVLEVIKQAGLKTTEIARVGLGTPGTQDLIKGMLLNPPNLKGWENFPIRDRVSHHCGLPVTYANDATAAAYGEFWVGSGREFNSMVLFTLGTGIGSGIIINDHTIDGEHSHGAECGHIVIDMNANARLCSCGKTGHLEAYASATALIKRTEEQLTAGRASSLTALIDNGAQLTPKLVGAEAGKGDPLSLEIVLDTAKYLGVGVVNLMHTVDPDGVLLGGAMTFGEHSTELGRQFLARVKQEVLARAFPIPAAKTKIDYATLGGDAGYIGAAGLARLAHNRH